MNEIHVGTDVQTGEPLYVPLSLFKQHCLIRGMTGAMKSVWALYLVLQIIRARNASVVYIDFGGDKFVFHGLRLTAETHKRVFRFMSTSSDDAWHTFNPLHVVTPLTETNRIRAINYLVTALALHPGEGFGKEYFGDIAVMTTHDLVSLCRDQGVLSPKIRDLAARVDAVARRYRRSDVAQVAMVLRQLALYLQLDQNQDDCKSILMPRALEEREIISAILPGILEPMAIRIGSFLCWAAVLSAMERVERGLPPRELYLVIDEFAVVAQSRAFESLLTLCRKFHVRLILLHQSTNQLRGDSRSTDLRPIVADNTALKLFLTSQGDDIESLRDLSRDVIKTRTGATLQGLRGSTQIRQIVEPELERNSILDASGIPGQGYLHIAQSPAGHQEPIRIRFDPIHFREIFTPERHAELANTPLPKRTAPLPAPKKRPPERSKRRETPPEKDAAWKRRNEALTRLLEAIREGERYEDSTG
jgi:hypothetical protein